MKSFAKTCLVALAALTLAAATVNAQVDSSSASTNTPHATSKRVKGKRFTGTVASVDSDAKTLTLAGSTPRLIQITSKTRIRFNGLPGTFSDAAVGLRVSGTEHLDASTNWYASTLNIGVTRKIAPASSPSTNSPSKE